MKKLFLSLLVATTIFGNVEDKVSSLFVAIDSNDLEQVHSICGSLKSLHQDEIFRFKRIFTAKLYELHGDILPQEHLLYSIFSNTEDLNANPPSIPSNTIRPHTERSASYLSRFFSYFAPQSHSNLNLAYCGGHGSIYQTESMFLSPLITLKTLIKHDPNINKLLTIALSTDSTDSEEELPADLTHWRNRDFLWHVAVYTSFLNNENCRDFFDTRWGSPRN